MDNQTLSISENAFQIVRASEEVEGFEYDWNNVSSNNLDLMKNISKDVVVEFLKCPETKITVVKNENNQYEVIAHNAIANIKINNMGNHFMGLVKVVEEAMDYKKRKELDPNTPLIRNNFPDVFPPHFSYMQANDYSSDFIREVNEQILLHRYGEIGIGDYRTVDLFGKNVNVMIASMKHGVLVNSDLKTEKSTGGNVVIKMKELIDWANNEAFKNSENTELKDGEYTVEVSLEGGSGKAKIESPTKLTVENGQAYAEIIWNSPNYDYMICDNQKYLAVNTDGNSVFEIPVSAFDEKINVSADTTAMSTPHEIEYTLYFNSESIKNEED